MRTEPDFLDSNVFLYAAGAEHPLREHAEAILRRVGAGELPAVTSAEVLQEILFVLGRRDRLPEALRLVARIRDLVIEVLPVTDACLEAACGLLAEQPALPIRDAIHAGTLRTHGLARIITADGDFDDVPGVVRVPLETAAG